MFVWAHPPNWSQGFEVTLRFLTDILTSHNGKQQRIARRFEPRITFEFQSMAKRSNFTQIQRELFLELRNEIVIPFWPDKQRLSTQVSGTSLNVNEIRPWMKANRLFCIVKDGVGEVKTIARQQGSTITLAEPLDNAWDAGSEILEGFKGHLNKTITQRAHTSEVNTVSVTFEVTPGFESSYIPMTMGTTFDELEVFTFPVNWKALPRVEIEDPRFVVDYDIGSYRILHSYDFPTIMRRVQLLRNGFEAIREIEDFYRRHRGRQREFYFPNIQSDLTPIEGIFHDTNILTVEGADVAAYLRDNTIHRAIGLKTSKGWYYNRIKSVLEGVGTTILQMRDKWPETFRKNEIERIAFLNVSNFASDAFSLEWKSDNIAITTVSISTLEDF